MKTSASDLARAAVAALAEALEKEGLQAKPSELSKLLHEALEMRSGTVVVTITTPDGTSGSLQTIVKDAIQKKTGKNVDIVERKNSSLIGGAVISYGDERIDLSVSRSLEDARMLLSPSH